MVLVADRRSALKKAFWRRHEKYLRIIAYSGPSGIPRIWLYGLQGARAGVSGSPARWILRGEGKVGRSGSGLAEPHFFHRRQRGESCNHKGLTRNS
jgi:hypothetical protein